MPFIMPFPWAWNWELENAPSFQTQMEKKFGVALELNCSASNIRKEVCGVLNSFLSFLKSFDKRKMHNMLVLMLDTKFKSSFNVFFHWSWSRSSNCWAIWYNVIISYVHEMLLSLASIDRILIMVLLTKKWMMTIVWIFLKW